MTPLHFLLLEDSLLDAELIQATLVEGGIDCELVQVQTQAEFLAALATQPFDLILSDYALPGFDGIAALETVRSIDSEIPFILVSGTLGEELAIETLKSGATDYILKQRLGRLVPSVQRALREAQERRDRRQAETALYLSESRYRTLANAVPQLMWMNDATGETQYFNERWQTYTGLSVKSFLNLNWLELVHPDDIQTLLSARTTGFETTTAYELECRIRRFDRVYRWHLCRVVPLKDEQGQVLSWFGTATDIHNIKQAEAGQRFLAEASAILTASLDYKITLATIAQLTVPFLADFCFFDLVTPDGKIQRAAWHHDEAAQDWFDQIQDFVPPPEFTNHPTAHVIATGKATFIPIVTDAWKQTVALSAEHLQFMQALQPASLIAVPLVAHDLRLGVLTCCFTAKSGRHYTETELHLAEELAHRAALALDNAQLYQQAQESNRIKDEFLAVLSHELRTPLNPILGWSRLLRSKYQDKVTLMRGLETIERNAQTQTQLIEDLLDVSRILRGKLSLKVCPVNLVATIQAAIETVRLAAEAKAIDLRLNIKDLHIDPTPPEVTQQISGAALANPSASDLQVSMLQPDVQVMGDPNRLQQVVWNILSNAVKFTPQGGQVHIDLECTSSASPAAQITVTDTGRGIPAHFLPYIFDYFRQADGSTTRNFGGLGLGLAIVRHLVELHGGTIEAASPGEGQGATFTVRLPLLVQATQKHACSTEVSAAPATPLPLAGWRILLVDDEKDTLEFMTFLLGEAGAIAVPVSSVREALATLETVNPDLLLSDIGMPEEDGYTLLRRVRSLKSAIRNVPAIALTAYARETDRQQVLAAGFQSHLTKPIEPEALITAITDLLAPLALSKTTD